MRCTVVQSTDYAPYVSVLISAILAIAAYFTKNYIIDPIRAFRAVCWQVDSDFTYHANVLNNNVNATTTEEAKAEMRQLSVSLNVQYKQIPVGPRELIGRFKNARIPRIEAVSEACYKLIGMSNSQPSADNSDLMQKIRGLLQIDI